MRRALTLVCEKVVHAGTRMLAAGFRTWIHNQQSAFHGKEVRS